MHDKAVAPTYIPSSRTCGVPSKIMSTQPKRTFPLTTQSGDSPASQASRIATLAQKDNGTMEEVEKDIHDKRGNWPPTHHVEVFHEEHIMTRLPVQRVYKKPQQKVRWTCEICQTAFTASHTCQTCEHQKCTSCIRDP
jgi:hypothetical protein